MKEIDKFYSKMDEMDSEGCINWLGTKNKKGYGTFSNKNFKTAYAHRIAYIIKNGEIPEGLLACHTCDNPGCVNADHIFIGTAKDNTQDMVNKKRGNLKKGERFIHAPFRPYAKLTECDVREIRKNIENGVTMVQLSKIYGVSDRTINDINSGRLWPSIDNESDRIARLEAVKKTRSRCASALHSKLSVENIIDIKKRLKNGETQKSIGLIYGVSQFCIWEIKNKKRWKNVK